MKTIAIVGLGLIGGSMALDLKASGFAKKILGVDSSTPHQHTALKRGLADAICDLDEAVNKADIIVLATPIDHIRQVLPHMLNLIEGSEKVVTDTGSTKGSIMQSVAHHPARSNYVAGHPMAGTERSGPKSAQHKLFKNKCAILCNVEASSVQSRTLVEEMYKALDMRIMHMDAPQHDMSAAFVSHISHVASFALSLCVQSKERNHQQISRLAGGGFASTVRLASSASSTWTPILTDNALPLLEALDAYMRALTEFRSSIQTGNRKALHQLIEQANQIEPFIQHKNENC